MIMYIIEIDLVVQEENFFNFMNALLQFCYYFPMLKGVAFPFEQT